MSKCLVVMFILVVCIFISYLLTNKKGYKTYEFPNIFSDNKIIT